MSLMINPLGRKPKRGFGPRMHACQCSGSAYSGARSNHDSCLHCGCYCSEGGSYRTGNNVNSVRTIRSSQ